VILSILFSIVQQTQNTTHEQEDTVIQHSKKESIFARSKYIRWKNDGMIDIPHHDRISNLNLNCTWTSVVADLVLNSVSCVAERIQRTEREEPRILQHHKNPTYTNAAEQILE